MTMPSEMKKSPKTKMTAMMAMNRRARAYLSDVLLSRYLCHPSNASPSYAIKMVADGWTPLR
jgi:hypothetical protein